jgi:ferritin-like metal-binding protein YciE
MLVARRRVDCHAAAITKPESNPSMPALENLHDLFVHELRDLFDAENQLVKFMPLLAKAARSEQLRNAFEMHLRQTKEQVRRLEQMFQALGTSPEGKRCKGMAGLIEEAKEMIEEEADPEVRDAGLIVAAQKVEHYEIAGYGSVCTFARVLKYEDALRVLKLTIDEEEKTDKQLTELAIQLNSRAETADQANE